MSVLVSPTEPPIIRTLGVSSPVPEDYGSDILIGASWGLIGVQRKRFPDDLMASMSDDRLARLVLKMGPLALRLMVLEGSPAWTMDGVLVHDRFKVHRDTIRAISWSLLRVYGVATVWSDSLNDTVKLVEGLSKWAEKDRHDSIGSRGGPSQVYGRTSHDLWGEFMLQGIEGIGPVIARAIIDRFGGVPLVWSVSPSDMAEVPGVGPAKIQRMGEVIPWKSGS